MLSYSKVYNVEYCSKGKEQVLRLPYQLAILGLSHPWEPGAVEGSRGIISSSDLDWGSVCIFQLLSVVSLLQLQTQLSMYFIMDMHCLSCILLIIYCLITIKIVLSLLQSMSENFLVEGLLIFQRLILLLCIHFI